VKADSLRCVFFYDKHSMSEPEGGLFFSSFYYLTRIFYYGSIYQHDVWEVCD